VTVPPLNPAPSRIPTTDGGHARTRVVSAPSWRLHLIRWPGRVHWSGHPAMERNRVRIFANSLAARPAQARPRVHNPCSLRLSKGRPPKNIPTAWGPWDHPENFPSVGGGEVPAVG